MIKGLKWERAEPDETAGWRIPGKIEHFEGVIGKMKLSEIERSFFHAYPLDAQHVNR
jgi:hypothetical protein